jgi:anti-sigma factor RsiW
MTHPREENLALFAGGDLGALERWRVSRHVRGCDACRAGVARFQRSAALLNDEAGRLPAGLNWDRLAAEMTGNIRVGLAAGECVAPSPAPRNQLGWRPAAVIALLTIVILGGWFLQGPLMMMPRQQRASLLPAAAADPVLEATPAGVEVKASRGALTLLNTRAASQTPGQKQIVVYVSAPGSLRARFVDSETGQVTINNVYTE